MRFALDTSVVLRLLTGLPEDQAASARERLQHAHRAGDDIVVSDLVVAEAFHALHHHYQVPKETARDLLRRMVTAGAIAMDPATSIAALEPRDGAGLVDRLILARHRALGATTITFDRSLGAHTGTERLRELVEEYTL